MINTKGCSFPTCFRTTMDEENQFCFEHDEDWQTSLNDWEQWKKTTDNPGYLPADSYEDGWIK